MALEAVASDEGGAIMAFCGPPDAAEGPAGLQTHVDIISTEQQVSTDRSKAVTAVGERYTGGASKMSAKKTSKTVVSTEDFRQKGPKSQQGKLVGKEDQETGAVGLTIYLSYCRVAGGVIVAFAALAGFTGMQVFQVRIRTLVLSSKK